MYRKGVVVVLYDKQKNLFLTAKRAKTKNSWQFVQGGIDDMETPQEAAKKELFEEVGILVETFDAQCGPHRYDYPKDCKYKEKGQEHIWFLKYVNKENIGPIVLNYEFEDYSWENLDFVMNHIVDFKKENYENALKDFGLFIQ